MSQSIFDDPIELELLAGHVLGDLTEEEAEQVESILARNDSSSDVLFDLENSAAGVQLALFRPDEAPMPQTIADRIRSEGLRILDERARGVGLNVDSAVSTAQVPSGRVTITGRESASVSGREWFAWLCAAAALMLAVTLWQRGPNATATVTADARMELIRQADSLIRVDWTDGKTPFDQPVSGDVVWDEKSQKGFMRFNNMPVNDPTVEQYQLWIIDPERDDEPIDGGVFDISEQGEVIVEIDAKLRVIDPAAFAITIEKPGGVVVSTQDRLPLLAAVSG